LRSTVQVVPRNRFPLARSIAALNEAREFGWSNSGILAVIVLSVVPTLSFTFIERKSKSPMLPLSLFWNPVFSWIVFTVLSGSAAFFSVRLSED
jgi:MFS transporter, DHA2 family, methylenomycin A resistance protein